MAADVSTAGGSVALSDAKGNLETRMNNTTIYVIDIGTLSNDAFQVVTSKSFIVVNCILHIIASFGAVLGNSLVILSVVKFQYMRSTIHVFVVSLACFDLALGVIGPFEQALLIWTAKYGMLQNVHLERLCQAQTGFMMCLGRGDMLSLTFMALDRFIYMIYPLRYPSIVTFNRALIGVGICLVYPPIIYTITSLVEGFRRPGVCAFPFMGIESKLNRNFAMVEICIIGISLLCFYTQIAKLACRKIHNNYVRPLTSNETITGAASDQRMSSAQAKVTRLIGLNVGVYLLVYALIFTTMLTSVSQFLCLFFFGFH